MVAVVVLVVLMVTILLTVITAVMAVILLSAVHQELLVGIILTEEVGVRVELAAMVVPELVGLLVPLVLLATAALSPSPQVAHSTFQINQSMQQEQPMVPPPSPIAVLSPAQSTSQLSLVFQ